MKPHSLEHISAWFGDALSDDKVFPQALDWASRLNLPLRAIVASRRANRRTMMAYDTRQSQAAAVDNMKAWGDACTQRGIALEVFTWLDDVDRAMEHFMRPHGMCFFMDDGTSPMLQELLCRSASSHDNAAVLCTPTCGPITRILVLCDQAKPSTVYLESVAKLCQALQIHPIVLIVAKTEHEANNRQVYAEGVCNSFRLFADFDFVVGCDVRSAVSRVASWRSCSHLIIERQNPGTWWQRTNGDLLEQLRGLSKSVNLLALPQGLALDLPPSIRRNQMGQSKNGSTQNKYDTAKECV
jgi:hypothetical protein